MTTIAECIETTYDLVLGGRRAAGFNPLLTTVTDTVTSIVFTYDTTGVVVAGDVLEIGDEQMVVVSMNTSTDTATVIRGWSGTTAAAHTAGVVVYVNPVVPQRQAREAITAEIRSLPPKLFQAVAQDIGTTSDGVNQYEITGVTDDSDILGTLSVMVGSFENDTRNINAPVRHRLVRNYQDGSPSIHLLDNPGSGRTLRVVLAQRFDTSNMDDDSLDLVADIGLDQSWIDIVAYGAAARLIGRLEAVRALSDRTSSGGQSQQVQQGTRANTAQYFKRFRDERIKEAHMELRGRYPWVSEG